MKKDSKQILAWMDTISFIKDDESDVILELKETQDELRNQH